jgi:hypothetical protein
VEPDRDDEEVVDGLPVVATPVAVEVRPAALPARQAAALAVTSFVAGAATVAMVTRRRTRVGLRRRRRRRVTGLGEVVASNSFLIDVHLLRRD